MFEPCPFFDPSRSLDYWNLHARAWQSRSVRVHLRSDTGPDLCATLVRGWLQTLLERFAGRNAFDVTTFHHSNGIHDQGRSGPGHPLRSSSGFFLHRVIPA